MIESVGDADGDGGDRNGCIGESDGCDLIAHASQTIGALLYALAYQPTDGECEIADGPPGEDGYCRVQNEAEDCANAAEKECSGKRGVAVSGLAFAGLAGADFAGHLAVDTVILPCDGFATDAATLGGRKLRDGIAGERRREFWLALVGFCHGNAENSMTMLRKSRRVSTIARSRLRHVFVANNEALVRYKVPIIDAMRLRQVLKRVRVLKTNSYVSSGDRY